MRFQRLDLYSHLSHELAHADMEIIETLDSVRLLIRRCIENPGDRSIRGELHRQKSAYWRALEMRESVAYELARVTSNG